MCAECFCVLIDARKVNGSFKQVYNVISVFFLLLDRRKIKKNRRS